MPKHPPLCRQCRQLQLLAHGRQAAAVSRSCPAGYHSSGYRPSSFFCLCIRFCCCWSHGLLNGRAARRLWHGRCCGCCHCCCCRCFLFSARPHRAKPACLVPCRRLAPTAAAVVTPNSPGPSAVGATTPKVPNPTRPHQTRRARPAVPKGAPGSATAACPVKTSTVPGPAAVAVAALQRAPLHGDPHGCHGHCPAAIGPQVHHRVDHSRRHNRVHPVGARVHRRVVPIVHDHTLAGPA
jgi:hypothetical protein